MDNEQEKKKGGEKMQEQKQTEITVKSKVNVAQSIGIAVAVLAIIGGITGAAFALFARPSTPATDSAPQPCDKPAAFILVSPANGATNQDDAVTLQWRASSGATSYDVYLGKTSSPTKVGTTTTVNYSATNLSVGTTYYWKVIAKNSCGSKSSSLDNFATAGWSFFEAQGYDPSLIVAACGGSRACDGDMTGVTCSEFNDIWLVCMGTANKCPDSLEDQCMQQSVCQCAGQSPGLPGCVTWLNSFTDPCL